MKKVSLLLLILPLSLIDLNAQSTYLEFLNVTAIGPQNVNWHLKEQVNHYVSTYEGLIDTLGIYEMEYIEKINKVKNQRKIRIRNKNRITELEADLLLIKKEQEILFEYIALWEDFEPKDYSNQINQLDFDSKCYDITGQHGFYSPNEYAIIEINQSENLFWTETTAYVIEERKTEEVLVERAKEEWIKKRADRNCLSANPNDCMVWCLVKTPAKYKTVVITEGGKVCDESFFLNEQKDECEKRIELLADTETPTKKYKLVEINSNKEIQLINYKEVNCN